MLTVMLIMGPIVFGTQATIKEYDEILALRGTMSVVGIPFTFVTRYEFLTATDFQTEQFRKKIQVQGLQQGWNLTIDIGNMSLGSVGVFEFQQSQSSRCFFEMYRYRMAV